MKKTINNDNNKDLHLRILKNPSFTNNSNKKLKLSDVIILYNDSKDWKIIPLNIFMMYPLIYDTYYETQKNNKNIMSIISVYVCPYTLFSAVYFNEFVLNNQIYNNNLTLIDANDNDILFIPIVNETHSIAAETLLPNKYVRRNEIKFMTLRNAISMYPDAMFIDLKQINMIEKLVPNDYITNDNILFKAFPFPNKYKPKTLIYVIEYKSKKINKYKYSVIIPKTNTFDIVKNGFDIYFDNMIEQIKNKGGIIYTCYWFAWSGINEKDTYKIITL